VDGRPLLASVARALSKAKLARIDGIRSFEGLRSAVVALRREDERALRELIRRLLELPMNRRTHFLRRRLPGGGSAI